MKKKDKSVIILIVVFFIGLSLLLYPSISNYWNSFNQSRAIAGYETAIANLDPEEYERMLKDAQKYNRDLLTKKNRYHMSDEERQEYESLLNISGDGIMGYIEIPSINTSLPIYHGMDEAVLQIAVGHFEGTSLPIGGESTHTVISSHRGLPSAKLFTDLDKLKEGDIFMLRVLNEVLTYEVDQILIVEPHEVDSLDIEIGEDYATLITCTPYGINTHRLLVRGHRIDNRPEALTVPADAIRIDPKLVAPLVAIPILIILVIWVFKRYSKGKK